MPPKLVTNQLCNWSATLWVEGKSDDEIKLLRTTVKNFLKGYCKKWGFSLERGTVNNHLHYQIMFSLVKKLTGASLIKLWATCSLPSAHICPLSNALGDKFTYVCKPGAIEGPWTSEDGEQEIPDDVEEMKMLRPWQDTLDKWAISKKWLPREVWILYDGPGGLGKTSFKRWIAWHRKDEVCVLPTFCDAKDFTRMVMSMRKDTTKCYIIDIPRGMDCPKMLKKLYSCIETLKDGSATEDRYKGRTVMFTPPRVLVFTNSAPNIDKKRGWMSYDRWKFINVKDGNLVHLTPEQACGGEQDVMPDDGQEEP